MHKIQFEVLEEAETSKIERGFLGSEYKVTNEKWVTKVGEVVAGVGDSGDILLRFTDTQYGFFNIYETADEDGIISDGYSENGNSYDIRNVKILSF